MKTWAEQFAPLSAKGWEIRSGQEDLGNSIIQTIEQGGILVGQASTGTGKSLATSIPLINKIKEQRSNRKTPYRGIISTETITLQTQLAEKDLPMLQKAYGGFTFSKLLGKSNYLCLNQAEDNAIGTVQVQTLINKIEKNRAKIINGEYADVCRALGVRDIDRELWAKLTGSSDYCGANDCNEEKCYGALARINALKADIVVVNHAMLAVDYEVKTTSPEGDGILGPYEVLIVDEAHKLEEVLSSQWTERMTEWEIQDHSTRLLTGITTALSFNKKDPVAFTEYETLMDELQKFFTSALKFFGALKEKYNEKWEGSETAMCLQYVMGPDAQMTKLMDTYETLGPALMDTFGDKMEVLEKYLTQSIVKMMHEKAPGKMVKNVRKALTSAKFLKNLTSILGKAMESKDAIISHGGTTYGVVADGWVKRKTNEPAMTIRCFPIDVSGKCKRMWLGKKSVALLSATLTDLTEGNFRYFKRSLGLDQCRETIVESPFKMLDQQLVYITSKQYEVTETTQFSMEELVDVVNAANGRALVLFTSRREIDLAQQELLQWKIAGKFNHTMYVQEKDVDKAKLVENFKNDTNSVLLGLKSMFTGIDIPGESLSLVAIVRWPLPRYSTECRMKIKYWRTAGFPDWYGRESLTVFQQASGRLIRSDSCVGSVALLDQRAYDAGSNVFKTALVGVRSLGSRVTHNIDDVTTHLGKVAV